MGQGPFDKSLLLSVYSLSHFLAPNVSGLSCAFPASAPRPVISPRSSVSLSQERLWGFLFVCLFFVFFPFNLNNCIYLVHQVLVAALVIFTFGMWDLAAGPGSQPGASAMEAWTQPLDPQGSPYRCGIFNKILSILEGAFRTSGHCSSRGLVRGAHGQSSHGDWVENGG